MKTKRLTFENRKIDVSEDGTITFCGFRDRWGRAIKPRETRGSNTHGYRQVSINTNDGQKTLAVHRLVAEAFLPTWDSSMQIDHINGDRSDNNAGNLRMVTAQGNQRAMINPRGSVCYRGVASSTPNKKNPFYARIREHGKTYCLGSFPTARLAARAYDAKAIELGFFPEALNFPQSLG